MPHLYHPAPDPAALVPWLLDHPLPGITDLVPGYTNLFVEFDEALSPRRVLRWLRQALPQSTSGKLHEIPVHYGEELPEIAQALGLSPDEVIARHSAPTYRVQAIGFLPGFPFLAPLDPRLELPRRPTPRPVPAHRVAIAGRQTGIYPLPSPGGWHLLGRALISLYDPHRDPPFLLEPGDRVRFLPSFGDSPPLPTPFNLLPVEPRFPVLRVEAPGLLDLLVDSGRFMVGRLGLARSGPLDPRSARRANALVGNPPGAPILELNLHGPILSALRPVCLAFAGFGMIPVRGQEPLPVGESFLLRPGETLRFVPSPKGARGYLALAGGFEANRFLGSSATDLRARIGRPLQAGDLLGAAKLKPCRPGFRLSQALEERPLRLLPGPQASPEALATLLSHPFRLAQGDRTALRLEGPPVPGGEVPSEGTPLGAIQVPPGGSPLILLQDRGTLGGYAKPALIYPDDLPYLAQLRPGAEVRFRLAGQ